MTPQEIDRIECAIRHIQTAVDVDPWAMEIAVEAMEKQIPRKPSGKGNNLMLHYMYCPQCGKQLTMYDWKIPYCQKCGQAIDWE